MAYPLSNRKDLKTCIRHFTWSWHTVVMGTGGVAGLISRFHFGQDSEAVKTLTLVFFFLNLLFFVAICGATIARYWMFPELWDAMLQHPAQSLFISTFPMGAATLINTALAINQNYSFSGLGFLYALWGFWWLDCAVSLVAAVGMLMVMSVYELDHCLSTYRPFLRITKQQHSLGQASTLWLFPALPLVVASSTGGLLADALAHHPTYAAITTAVSLIILLIGLSLAGMLATVYLMRLLVYGLDGGLVLSSFIILGPLGQGGFSFLVNGQNVARIPLPAHLSPAAIQTATFCAAWVLCVLREQSIPFSVAYWGTIFPTALVALLTGELGVVLESHTLNYLGAIFF
ncbi:Sulfite efflux pump SSU1 [Mycena sanguinolenta]|uniref:Sulfite efflux pump SSU1 n=1 Tax=Mycena sanguinolenta TaxID=230812 RepID=A0A8H7CX93_9AGAR|nr:Sulfite efflux pump SSU1 [Mycena sanguinolenta]